MAEDEPYSFFQNIINYVVESIYASIESMTPKFEEDTYHLLTMEELGGPMMLVFCVYGIAIMIFLGEIMVYNWRQQNVREYSSMFIVCFTDSF